MLAHKLAQSDKSGGDRRLEMCKEAGLYISFPRSPFFPYLFTHAPRNPADGPLLTFTLALHTHKRLKRSVINWICLSFTLHLN